MDTAKILWSGRSQAVRLPKAFRLDTADVRIPRQGNAVIIEPVATDWAWLDEFVGTVDDDVEQTVAEQPTEQYRPSLNLFR